MEHSIISETTEKLIYASVLFQVGLNHIKSISPKEVNEWYISEIQAKTEYIVSLIDQMQQAVVLEFSKEA